MKLALVLCLALSPLVAFADDNEKKEQPDASKNKQELLALVADLRAQAERRDARLADLEEELDATQAELLAVKTENAELEATLDNELAKQRALQHMVAKQAFQIEELQADLDAK